VPPVPTVIVTEQDILAAGYIKLFLAPPPPAPPALTLLDAEFIPPPPPPPPPPTQINKKLNPGCLVQVPDDVNVCRFVATEAAGAVLIVVESLKVMAVVPTVIAIIISSYY
jgi:hypothetical protein